MLPHIASDTIHKALRSVLSVWFVRQVSWEFTKPVAISGRVAASEIVERIKKYREYSMHIVLGLLGTVVTILVLLNRLAEAGIDLGGLNPFLWQRRRKWRKQYEGNPVFKIEDPLDATAILMVAVAKSDGDMTSEAKKLILELFEKVFGQSKKDAGGKIRQFLAPSRGNFTESKAGSAMELLEKVANLNTPLRPNTHSMLEQCRQALISDNRSADDW